MLFDAYAELARASAIDFVDRFPCIYKTVLAEPVAHQNKQVVAAVPPGSFLRILSAGWK